jgi:hypothetical protein
VSALGGRVRVQRVEPQYQEEIVHLLARVAVSQFQSVLEKRDFELISVTPLR